VGRHHPDDPPRGKDRHQNPSLIETTRASANHRIHTTGADFENSLYTIRNLRQEKILRDHGSERVLEWLAHPLLAVAAGRFLLLSQFVQGPHHDRVYLTVIYAANYTQ
jgi:hypothetical protein